MPWHNCWTGFRGFGPFPWLLLAAAGLWLVFGRRADPRVCRVENPALEIARQRYARGEISKEELDRIRNNLD